MKTVEQITTNEIMINKSKFITYLIPINSIKQIEDYLTKIKIKYKDATHYCYAYILENNKRFSDNGEPNGTAGMPILNVLKQQDLDHVLCVVIRYFGGTKLGAGGLVRAYTNSVSECIKHSSIINMIEGYNIEITFSYDNLKQIDYLLQNYEITNKQFKDNIIYNVNIPLNINIKTRINNYILNYIEKEKILIKN